MIDFEWMILEVQESEADDCKNCPYASVEKCEGQCMEIHYCDPLKFN